MDWEKELNRQELAGKIWLVLRTGSPEDRQSLLRVIELILGPEARSDVEFALKHMEV